jgi:hypothetical protein
MPASLLVRRAILQRLFIANRLKVLGLFRLDSLSRKTEDLNKDLHQYARVNDNNVFAFPLVEDMKKYRVSVKTHNRRRVVGDRL